MALSLRRNYFYFTYSKCKLYKLAIFRIIAPFRGFIIILMKIFIQYCCPQHILSRLAGRLAECRSVWFKNWAIKRLIRKYQVNVHEALLENIADYPTFNSFFIRQLKPALRPLAKEEEVITSPVDGYVSQIGRIKEQAIFQAKKFYFDTSTLLGGFEKLACLFTNGHFATFYLAPHNYHRVHMPLAGTLRKTIYIPGKLFSVNAETTQKVPQLFTRNERLVCLFDTAVGPMAMVLVGAMLVGHIETVWPMPPRSKKIAVQDYLETIYLEKGAELGYFKMGSTVIVLFAKDQIEWENRLTETLTETSTVKMGEAIGKIRKG
ncbi:MAG: hypothetical protein ACD_60C00162G0027 [uncultured bacterium]|nr:MAG: hypothetical protein ACD_60C00162G0027 [uncultured bacterium]